MLILSRKVNECIVINGQITVQVKEIRGDKVRLGVIAPPEIVIDRKEIHEQRNNQTTLSKDSQARQIQVGT